VRSVPSRFGNRLFIGSVAAAVLLAAGGLAAASLVKSPAEVAAETRPPVPATLTAPVVRQVVRAEVVIRGAARASGEISDSPSTEQDANTLVITAVNVHPGDQVSAGDVLFGISGRPLFVLPGRFPAYRDMEPGDVGPDVAELQSALAGLGFPCGDDTSGSFGAGTEVAVRDFYAAIGYPVATASGAGSSGSAGSGAGLSAVTARSLTTPTTSPTPTSSPSPSPSPTPSPTRSPSPAPSRSPLPTRSSSPPPSRAPAPGKNSEAIVPQSEVIFVPKLPARIIAVTGAVGSTVKSSLVTLASGGAVITGQLDPSQRALIRPGMAVDLTDNLSGWSGRGRVTRLSAVTVSANGAAYVPVTVEPDKALPTAELGQNLELQIVAASTNGPALAVPEAAIIVNAAGQSLVQVKDPGHALREVRVKTGVSGGGLVAVTPVSGMLVPGDQVVTGA
jgi:HlyD family secretion protein